MTSSAPSASASLINNVILEYHPVHRFLMNRVLDNNDYVLSVDGLNVVGYGENPLNVLVSGVSCFDPEPVPDQGHGVVDSRTQLDEPCSVLTKAPKTVKLAQDYELSLRYRKKNAKKQLNVKHYTIYPVDGMSVDEFDRIIHGGGEDCCQWTPCQIKAEGLAVDDGCDDSDLDNIHDFGVRALYQFSKCVFTRLNVHDRVIINGVLTLISGSSQDFDSIIAANKAMFALVYRILYPQVDLSPTLTNYAGIVLGKIEDALFPDDADEDPDASDLAGIMDTVLLGEILFFQNFCCLLVTQFSYDELRPSLIVNHPIISQMLQMPPNPLSFSTLSRER